MIRKSENRFSFATNAWRLRGDHAQTKRLERGFGAIAEIAVQGGDDLCALADRPADTLDRARPHVADGEHAGHGGFQRRDLPSRIELRLRAGDDEAAAVERDAAAVEPAGGGIGTDEQKEIAD